jgi:hypothetical protein
MAILELLPPRNAGFDASLCAVQEPVVEGPVLAGQIASGAGGPERYGPVLATIREELDEVERAMQRVEDGSYGRCETCGAVLSSDQLDAFPLGRRCPSCS